MHGTLMRLNVNLGSLHYWVFSLTSPLSPTLVEFTHTLLILQFFCSFTPQLLLVSFQLDISLFLPVVPHKAVAEVSKIGNL